MSKELTAIIESEGDGYVALCPEVDVASQGETVTEARANLQEALELFFETASLLSGLKSFRINGLREGQGRVLYSSSASD